MTREELEYRTQIQQAHLDGKQIQWQRIDTMLPNEWYPLDSDAYDLDWSVRNYRIAPDPWRSRMFGEYYVIDMNSDPHVYKSIDEYGITDEQRFLSGNYFQTKEDAESALSEIREVLIKYRKYDTGGN